jgi:hypothetical protein
MSKFNISTPLNSNKICGTVLRDAQIYITKLFGSHVLNTHGLGKSTTQ